MHISKQTIKSLTLFLIACFIYLGISAQENYVKIFPFKSAIIEYKYEASIKGTRVLYIDDYGYKQADYIRKQANFGGNTEKDYQNIILVGEKAYTIDLQENTVAVGRNSTYNYYLLNQNRKCTDVSDAILQSANGYKPKGTKKYLGKTCKVWEAGNATQLTWNGVMLSSEINFMTMMVEKAVKIETDVDIPADKFEIPDGYKYISSDVYQGFSGLELNFEEAETKPETDENSMSFSFNSGDLDGTDNMPFYTQEGEKVIQDGVNDFNKIDYRIIKSQTHQMISSQVELKKFSTLVFIQEDCYGKDMSCYGKMQISKIDEAGFTYRYMIFDQDEIITGYSNSTDNALSNIVEITPNNDNRKLIITPKGETKCFVMGW